MKKKSQSSETESDNAVIKKLEAIFTAEPASIDTEIQSSIDRLNKVKEYIGDAFIKVLGTTADWAIGESESSRVWFKTTIGSYIEDKDGNLIAPGTEIEESQLGDAETIKRYLDLGAIEALTHGGLSQKEIVVAGKEGFDARNLDDVFTKTWNALFEFGFSLDDGLNVINGVINHINNQCTLTYQFVNDSPHVLTDNDVLPIIAENDILSKPNTKQPEEVVAAIARIKGLAEKFIQTKTQSDIEPLGLADKIVAIERRLAWLNGTDHAHGLKILLDEYKREVELEKQRKEINDSIKHERDSTATVAGDAQKAKIKRHPDLTIDRAILLIDVIGGSRLKGADKDKLAEVIAFLTGDLTESVRQRYSALNPNNDTYKGNTESGISALQADLEVLSHYFDLIGLRGELNKLSDRLGIPLTK